MTDHIAEEEDRNFKACLSAAQQAGVTKEEALYCEAGVLGCANCPFRQHD